jgi:hypothetical protein
MCENGSIVSPFLTSPLSEDECQLHAPAALLQEKKSRYLSERTLFGLRANLYAVKKRKNLGRAWNRIPVVQPVSHRYTEFSRLQR